MVLRRSAQTWPGRAQRITRSATAAQAGASKASKAEVCGFSTIAKVPSRPPNTAPRRYRPRPPLADYVQHFGIWAPGAGTTEAHASRALPRGAATVIIDISGRADLGLYASDGRTPLPVPPAFIIGAGVTSYVTRIDPTQASVTVHFRPAGALAFTGCPLSELEDRYVDLADLWDSSAEVLREQLIQASPVATRVALLEAFLLHRMRGRHARPEPQVASVLDAAERSPSMRVSQAHDLIGWSPKRFNALFRAQVGLSPKAYFRVRRMQAALRALDTSACGATIAADLGYFDQSHFVREFQEFAAITPTQYARRRSSMPGHVQLD